MGCKYFVVGLPGYSVRQREFEVLGEELSDVGSLYVFRLLDFNHSEDLCNCENAVSIRLIECSRVST